MEPDRPGFKLHSATPRPEPQFPHLQLGGGSSSSDGPGWYPGESGRWRSPPRAPDPGRWTCPQSPPHPPREVKDFPASRGRAISPGLSNQKRPLKFPAACSEIKGRPGTPPPTPSSKHPQTAMPSQVGVGASSRTRPFLPQTGNLQGPRQRPISQVIKLNRGKRCPAQGNPTGPHASRAPRDTLGPPRRPQERERTLTAPAPRAQAALTSGTARRRRPGALRFLSPRGPPGARPPAAASLLPRLRLPSARRPRACTPPTRGSRDHAAPEVEAVVRSLCGRGGGGSQEPQAPHPENGHHDPWAEGQAFLGEGSGGLPRFGAALSATVALLAR